MCREKIPKFKVNLKHRTFDNKTYHQNSGFLHATHNHFRSHWRKQTNEKKSASKHIEQRRTYEKIIIYRTLPKRLICSSRKFSCSRNVNRMSSAINSAFCGRDFLFSLGGWKKKKANVNVFSQAVNILKEKWKFAYGRRPCWFSFGLIHLLLCSTNVVPKVKSCKLIRLKTITYHREITSVACRSLRLEWEWRKSVNLKDTTWLIPHCTLLSWLLTMF